MSNAQGVAWIPSFARMQRVHVVHKPHVSLKVFLLKLSCWDKLQIQKILNTIIYRLPQFTAGVWIHTFTLTYYLMICYSLNSIIPQLSSLQSNILVRNNKYLYNRNSIEMMVS